MYEPLFQYQARAAPPPAAINGGAENINLDKWHAQHPPPVRIQFRNHAYPAEFRGVTTTFAETLHADRWYVQHPPPVLRQYRNHAYPAYFKNPIGSPAAGGAIATIDAWGNFQFPPPIPPRKVPPTFGQPVFSAALTSADVNPSEWAPLIVQPPLLRRRPVPTTGVTPINPSLFVTPTMTSWYQPASEPTRQPRQTPGMSVATMHPPLFGVPQIVCWSQPAIVPVRPQPRQTGLSVSITHPFLVRTPTVDSWHFRQPDQFRKNQPQSGGATAPLQVTPFGTSWQYVSPMPAYRARRAPLGESVIGVQPLPTPLVTMWESHYVMPTYRPQPRQTGRSNAVDVLLDLQGSGVVAGLDGEVYICWHLEGLVGLEGDLDGWVGLTTILEDRSMIRDNKLYIGSDNPVVWNGLSHRGTFINNATVAWVLKVTSSQATVASGSCTYLAGSSGDYEGNIEEDVALVDGTEYDLEVTATASGDRVGFRKITYRAQYRGSN